MEPIGSKEVSLRDVWSAPRYPLKKWVRAVEAAFNENGLDLLDAAEETESTAAELEAVIRLALLDDSTLEMVSAANPPMTTWLLLAEVPSADIPTVLEVADGIDGALSDFQRMFRAVSEVIGGVDASVIQNLDPTLLDFVLRKAKAYSVWTNGHKNYRALSDFAARRRSGKPLTAKQTSYAKGMLVEVVEGGVIRVPSPDGDDELCEQVLQVIK